MVKSPMSRTGVTRGNRPPKRSSVSLAISRRISSKHEKRWPGLRLFRSLDLLGNGTGIINIHKPYIYWGLDLYHLLDFSDLSLWLSGAKLTQGMREWSHVSHPFLTILSTSKMRNDNHQLSRNMGFYILFFMTGFIGAWVYSHRYWVDKRYIIKVVEISGELSHTRVVWNMAGKSNSKTDASGFCNWFHRWKEKSVAIQENNLPIKFLKLNTFLQPAQRCGQNLH